MPRRDKPTPAMCQLAHFTLPRHQHPVHPIDIVPACPLPRAQVITRYAVDGSPRVTLQALEEGAGAGAGGSCSPPGYRLDSILMTNPRTGVIIFLATPLTPHTHAPAPDLVVVKAVPYHPSHPPDPDSPLREVAALQLLPSHPHITPLLACMQDRHFVYLVFPYLAGGDLFSKVKGSVVGLQEYQARSYLRQMAEGLLFMKQTNGIAHMDVSLENVMLSEGHNHVSIIDLGMCLRVPPPCAAERQGGQEVVAYLLPQRCRGKAAYVAPQVVREEAFDPFAADVWSLGVCLYAMLTGRHLYDSPSNPAFSLIADGKVRQVVRAYEGYGLPRLSLPAMDLVCAMLHADPAQQPTLEEVLAHDFFLPTA